MDFQPIGGQAFQARDFVADFVIQNFRTAAGDGIESGIAQARNGIAQGELAVFRNGENFRSRVAMQVNFREPLFDSGQHAFVPVNLEIGMQSPLHQHTRAAEFNRLTDFFVDGVEVEDVASLTLAAGPFRGR